MNDFKDQSFRSVEYTSFGEAQGHLASWVITYSYLKFKFTWK